MSIFSINSMLDCCFTDTSSLVYEIKKVDVYENLYQDKDLFILANIHQTQSFLIQLIKKLLVK